MPPPALFDPSSYDFFCLSISPHAKRDAVDRLEDHLTTELRVFCR